MNQYRVIGFLMLGVLGVFLSVPDVDAADLKRIMIFEMEDQYGKKHTHEELRGKIFMVMGADKAGSGYTETWTIAIQDGLKEREDAEPVELVPAPQLGDVPKLLRGTVKKFIAKDSKRWLLFDWESKFTKAYSLKPGTANILLFDAKGNLVRKISKTKVDPKIVEEIVEEVAKLQKEK